MDDTFAGCLVVVTIIVFIALGIYSIFVPDIRLIQSYKCINKSKIIDISPVGHQYKTTYMIKLESGDIREVYDTKKIGDDFCIKYEEKANECRFFIFCKEL